MTITAILQGKGREVTQVRPDDSVLSVVQLLSERRIGCVPVVGDGQVVGIFSERDVLYCMAHEGAQALDRTVGEVMTAPAITIEPATRVDEALALMTQRRIRHLPVVEGEIMCGFISIGDLVKSRLDEVERDAAAMRSYITTG